MNGQQYGERKAKLEESLGHVNTQFRKLHLIHDKVAEISHQTDDPTPQVGCKAKTKSTLFKVSWPTLVLAANPRLFFQFLKKWDFKKNNNILEIKL